MRKILLAVVLLFLLASLGVMVVFISERTTLFGKAFGPSLKTGIIEVENSYMFASPLVAKADGKEKIRVTVFILDGQGRGVSGKLVSLGEDQRLAIDFVQQVTDSLGRAIFDISATAVADYLLEARVENQVLPQAVRVSFR